MDSGSTNDHVGNIMYAPWIERLTVHEGASVHTIQLSRTSPRRSCYLHRQQLEATRFHGPRMNEARAARDLQSTFDLQHSSLLGLAPTGPEEAVPLPVAQQRNFPLACI
jgi:hypothetical protein